MKIVGLADGWSFHTEKRMKGLQLLVKDCTQEKSRFPRFMKINIVVLIL